MSWNYCPNCGKSAPGKHTNNLWIDTDTCECGFTEKRPLDNKKAKDLIEFLQTLGNDYCMDCGRWHGGGGCGRCVEVRI